MDIRFERGDKGLGLSIAGGLGSTPYKPNDEYGQDAIDTNVYNIRCWRS